MTINQIKSHVNSEKGSEFLKKMGATLHQQRTVVSQKSVMEFAVLMSDFSTTAYTPALIEKMESGAPDVHIIYWMHIWQYFQNIDRILSAYDAKAMMYLARQELLPEIEKEIMAHHHGAGKEQK